MAWLERWGGGGTQKKKEVNEEVLIDHHFANLHDEDEDRAGEKTDLATGKAIDNSGDVEAADLNVHEFNRAPGSNDALGQIETDPEDPAEKWLRENDPERRKAA